MALADYAMSSGLEDLNDKEVMDMIQQQVADFSSLYPNYIRPSPSEATAYPIPSDDSQLSPNETMFNRVINRVSPPDPDGPNPNRGYPARGGMLSSRMDSGLEDFLNEPPSQAQSTEEEPELFRTLWNLIQKSLQKDMFTGMFGEGKDKKDTDTPFFKPLSASQLVEHEKFVNQAPLVERWAIDMKEEIGWQYMTPAERKDYIKKNKNNKNNHIIMDYNMYRRG